MKITKKRLRQIIREAARADHEDVELVLGMAEKLAERAAANFLQELGELLITMGPSTTRSWSTTTLGCGSNPDGGERSTRCAASCAAEWQMPWPLPWISKRGRNSTPTSISSEIPK